MNTEEHDNLKDTILKIEDEPVTSARHDPIAQTVVEKGLVPEEQPVKHDDPPTMTADKLLKMTENYYIKIGLPVEPEGLGLALNVEMFCKKHGLLLKGRYGQNPIIEEFSTPDGFNVESFNEDLSRNFSGVIGSFDKPTLS